MRAAGLLVALAALSLALVGCATVAAPEPAPAPLTPSTPAEAIPHPIAVSIPSIDAASSLIETGLVDGVPEVPPETDPLQASWATFTPAPGVVGPAVIYGHVDGQIDGKRGQPGVFHRLRSLQPGAEIVVDRLAAAPLTFVVDQVKSYPKAAFLPRADGSPSAATLEVYGDVDGPQLRLVTCGGEFDHARRTYRDQIVAFAHLRGP